MTDRSNSYRRISLPGISPAVDGYLIPEPALNWIRHEARAPVTAGFDNVACFFRLAGFDAVVPGREDFRFGPERLRELARYLASNAPGGTPVQMLGANLVINTISVKPPRAVHARTWYPHGIIR